MVQVVSARKQRFLNPWNADVTLPSAKKKKVTIKSCFKLYCYSYEHLRKSTCVLVQKHHKTKINVYLNVSLV